MGNSRFGVRLQWEAAGGGSSSASVARSVELGDELAGCAGQLGGRCARRVRARGVRGVRVWGGEGVEGGGPLVGRALCVLRACIEVSAGAQGDVWGARPSVRGPGPLMLLLLQPVQACTSWLRARQHGIGVAPAAQLPGLHPHLTPPPPWVPQVQAARAGPGQGRVPAGGGPGRAAAPAGSSRLGRRERARDAGAQGRARHRRAGLPGLRWRRRRRRGGPGPGPSGCGC
jgi:hypothetical protein